MKYILVILLVMHVELRVAVAQQVYTEIEITSAPNDAFKQVTAENIEATLVAFQQAYETGDMPVLEIERYTSEGLAQISQLWAERPFRCLFSRIKNGIVRRSIDGRFEFRGVTFHLEDDRGEVLTQEGVFIVDETGRIDGFRFGLELHRAKQILEDGIFITENNHRFFILDFVENFRTAYHRKDLGYLESVFSDDALIIVGRVIQRSTDQAVSDQLLSGLGMEQVEFIRKDKNEYLASLRDVFARNQYIKVEFESVRVYSHGEIEGIYGVQLVQYWHSHSDGEQGYKDEGYLFLLIDLRDIDKPMIHVRTWQPKEDTASHQAIGLNNFILTQ